MNKISELFFAALALVLYPVSKLVERVRYWLYVEIDADGTRKDGEE